MRRLRFGRGAAFARRQRGIAMLVAILLVALGTIIAAAVAYESAMTARRGTATFSFDEAILVSQGAEALAGYGLRTFFKASGKAPDIFASQAWAQPVGPLEVAPGMTLEASLEDLQGRFNLNSLIINDGSDKPDPQAVKAFKQLLEMLNLEDKWADLLVDWIDQNAQTQPDGAEDSTYLGQNPPYLPANKFITSSSELLALPAFGRERYERIKPYVVALPPGVAINICTAPGHVLDAFLGGQRSFSNDEEALAKSRANAPGCFPTPEGYQANFAAGNDSYANVSQTAGGGNRFGTTSGYFRLTSLVTIGTSEFNLYSLLYVDANNPPMVHPIMRSFTPD
jgi:general secretion pathway protein K